MTNTNLSEHFTLAEFTRSDVATRRDIDNTLPPTLAQRAVDTAHMMERIRTALGRQAERLIQSRAKPGGKVRDEQKRLYR